MAIIPWNNAMTHFCTMTSVLANKSAGEASGTPFVFYYYLEHPGANKLVVQRGRFAGWDRNAFRFFAYPDQGGVIIPAGNKR
jgi:hypothetical protein